MDTLDDDDLIGMQLHDMTFFALCRCEVEFGELHFFPAHQGLQVFVEKLDVQCLQHLKVVFAIFVARRFLAVDEIVIEFQRVRAQAVRQKLHGQSLGEGCLPGG